MYFVIIIHTNTQQSIASTEVALKPASHLFDGDVYSHWVGRFSDDRHPTVVWTYPVAFVPDRYLVVSANTHTDQVGEMMCTYTYVCVCLLCLFVYWVFALLLSLSLQDPMSWELQGSSDGANSVTLDVRTDFLFASRHEFINIVIKVGVRCMCVLCVYVCVCVCVYI